MKYPTQVRLMWCMLLLAVAAALPTQAQTQKLPFFDGLTVGLGLNVYQGDFDSNPENDPIKFLGKANINALVSLDRSFGKPGMSIDLNLNRFTARSRYIDMANNLISIDAVGTYRLDVFQRGFARLYAGVGGTLLIPEYYRFTAEDDGYRQLGTRPIVTVPVGIIIQERVRLGIRLAFTDYIDGRSAGGDRDYLTFFNLGYRFNFIK